MKQLITIIHPSGYTQTGTIRHDRSGTGPQICVGNVCRSYPQPNDKSSSIKVVDNKGPKN